MKYGILISVKKKLRNMGRRYYMKFKNHKSQVLLATLGAAGALAMANTASADTRVTVQQGDTVAQLAQKYDSSVQAIADANHLADPNVILVGQQLEIPTDKVNDDNGDTNNNQSGNQNGINQASYNLGNVNNSVDANGNPVNSTASQSANVSQTNNTPSYYDYGGNSGVNYRPMQDAARYDAVYNGGQNVVSPASYTAQATAGASTNVSQGASYSPAQAVSRAQSQLGVPYVWGGETPGRGFDCSGLVNWAYGLSSNNRTTYTQQAMGAHHYDVQNAQSGDLYFWGSDAAPHHVAVATGNGNYIQAPQPGQNVQNGNINWYRPNYYVSMNN